MLYILQEKYRRRYTDGVLAHCIYLLCFAVFFFNLYDTTRQFNVDWKAVLWCTWPKTEIRKKKLKQTNKRLSDWAQKSAKEVEKNVIVKTVKPHSVDFLFLNSGID